jgi:hypothetical protein
LAQTSSFRRRLAAIAASVTLLAFGVLGVPAAEASTPVTSKSIFFLLVNDGFSNLGVTTNEVKDVTVNFLNDYFAGVSYNKFHGFGAPNIVDAKEVTGYGGDLCNRGEIWKWAHENYSNSADIYVVVVPSIVCPSSSSDAGARESPFDQGKWFAWFNDQQLVDNPKPTAEAVYLTVMEIGAHPIMGATHANALDCTLSFSWSCFSTATAAGPVPDPNGEQISSAACATRDGTVPYDGQICAYGDPWDAMGNDFPESGGYRVGTIPGDARLNGIELDKAGWLQGRESTGKTAGPPSTGSAVTKGVYSIRPLEEAATSTTPQVQWLPAVSGSTPNIEIEYRRPAQDPRLIPPFTAPFANWLDGFLTGCVTAGVDCGWPEVTGGVLLHAVSQGNGQSQSLLIDATPDSNNAQLCPSDKTGIFFNNAFCDWYDAALQPADPTTDKPSFVPNGTYVAPYYVTVLSASAREARVAVNPCPCEDPFSPSSGSFGNVQPGGSKSITFTIKNKAAGVTHTLSSPVIAGFDSSAFSVVSNNCAALPPTGSCQITISFHPSTERSFSAILDVKDTNPVFPTEALALSGSGRGWSGFQSLKGVWPNSDHIALGANADGRLQLFMVGENHSLYTDYQKEVNGGWSGFRSFGGVWPNSDHIALGANADGRLQLFMVGENHSLYTDYQTQINGGWLSKFESFGGAWPNSDHIALGPNADGRLQLFMLAENGELVTNYQTEVNGGFLSEFKLFGQVEGYAAWSHSDDIALGANADGRLQLFMVGPFNESQLSTAYQREVNERGNCCVGGGSEFVTLRGTWSQADSIAVASNQNRTMQLFLIGQNGHLYTRHQEQANGGFACTVEGCWEDLGGPWPAGDHVAAAPDAQGRLNLFLIGQNGQLYTNRQTTVNGQFGTWQSLGESAAGNWPATDWIAVAPNQDGRLQAFLVGPNGQLYTVYQR